MPARDIGLDTLRGVLAGEILVQNHCYRADEMAIVIDMAKEFGYHVAAFHHAVEAYKIADLLRDNHICAAMWADWYGFKMEAYDGIQENIALVHNAGACAMVHSDDPNGIQRLNQEAAKAQAAGRRIGINIPDEVAWEWLSFNPAKALGISDKTGSLKPGKMADVVLWNGNPFSVYTRPREGLDRRRAAVRRERPAPAPGQRLRARPARRRGREVKRLACSKPFGLSLSKPSASSRPRAGAFDRLRPNGVALLRRALAAPRCPDHRHHRRHGRARRRLRADRRRHRRRSATGGSSPPAAASPCRRARR